MSLYDPSTALIVVDVQNEFGDPRGSLFVEGGEEVVAAANAEIIRALAAGAHVYYTQDWHPPSTPHFETEGGRWPIHCVRETWGAELHHRLVVAGPVVRKGSKGEDGYSGFTMRRPGSEVTVPTPLGGLLADQGAVRVVVVGLAFDYCVQASALDAAALGYETTVLLSATAAVEATPGDEDRVAGELQEAGVRLD